MKEDIVIRKAQANLDALPMVFATMLDLASFNHLNERINRLSLNSLRMANAELVLFYLYHEERLRLVSCVKSDYLHNVASHKYSYEMLELPVGNSSLAGSCAAQGKICVVKNAARASSGLETSLPLVFESLSDSSAFSMLNMPLIDEYNRLLGVMQFVNCKPYPSKNDIEAGWLAMLQAAATQTVAQGIQAHSNLMRSLGIVQLHDPKETLGHVNRMGAYAAELYNAMHVGLHEDQIVRYRDIVRLAVMMHDIGKVAVPLSILQKSGPLDLREFTQLQSHTIKGAGLFLDGDSELDRVCMEVVLNHHEHWDGSGYPGGLLSENNKMGGGASGKSGDEIPLFARMTLLLDTYDTLTHLGRNNTLWPENDVLAHIRAGSGRQFDPGIVKAFFDNYELMKTIGQGFSN